MRLYFKSSVNVFETWVVFVGFSQEADLHDYCWIWVRYFSKQLMNSWELLGNTLKLILYYFKGSLQVSYMSCGRFQTCTVFSRFFGPFGLNFLTVSSYSGWLTKSSTYSFQDHCWISCERFIRRILVNSTSFSFELSYKINHYKFYRNFLRRRNLSRIFQENLLKITNTDICQGSFQKCFLDVEELALNL